MPVFITVIYVPPQTASSGDDDDNTTISTVVIKPNPNIPPIMAAVSDNLTPQELFLRGLESQWLINQRKEHSHGNFYGDHDDDSIESYSDDFCNCLHLSTNSRVWIMSDKNTKKTRQLTNSYDLCFYASPLYDKPLDSEAVKESFDDYKSFDRIPALADLSKYMAISKDVSLYAILYAEFNVTVDNCDYKQCPAEKPDSLYLYYIDTDNNIERLSDLEDENWEPKITPKTTTSDKKSLPSSLRFDANGKLRNRPTLEFEPTSAKKSPSALQKKLPAKLSPKSKESKSKEKVNGKNANPTNKSQAAASLTVAKTSTDATSPMASPTKTITATKKNTTGKPKKAPLSPTKKVTKKAPPSPTKKVTKKATPAASKADKAATGNAVSSPPLSPKKPPAAKKAASNVDVKAKIAAIDKGIESSKQTLHLENDSPAVVVKKANKKSVSPKMHDEIVQGLPVSQETIDRTPHVPVVEAVIVSSTPRKRGRPKKDPDDGAPKPKRGRPKKSDTGDVATNTVKRKPGRPKKVDAVDKIKNATEKVGDEGAKDETIAGEESNPTATPTKRKPGRPKKADTVDENGNIIETPKRKVSRPKKVTTDENGNVIEKPKRKPGRPRKDSINVEPTESAPTESKAAEDKSNNNLTQETANDSDQKNAEPILGEPDGVAPTPSTPKRKLGRPKKVDTADNNDGNVTPKRKAGRPKKTSPQKLSTDEKSIENMTITDEKAAEPIAESIPEVLTQTSAQKSDPVVKESSTLTTGSPERKRGRPKKTNAADTNNDASDTPKKKLGRPRKNSTNNDEGVVTPKKKRGRPKKVDTTPNSQDTVSEASERKPGRPRKDSNIDEKLVDSAAMTSTSKKKRGPPTSTDEEVIEPSKKRRRIPVPNAMSPNRSINEPEKPKGSKVNKGRKSIDITDNKAMALTLADKDIVENDTTKVEKETGLTPTRTNNNNEDTYKNRDENVLTAREAIVMAQALQDVFKSYNIVGGKAAKEELVDNQPLSSAHQALFERIVRDTDGEIVESIHDI